MNPIAPLSTDSLPIWLDYWANIHVTAIDLGLERVLPVARALNVLTPQAKVFTVAGTNGKGSTTTTLSSILVAAGYNIGLYQSPHIFSFNERVRINGVEIDDQTFIDAFVEVEQARQVCGLTLSFFEATTLAAFCIFNHRACDVWVLEIGLGGRLDVVNIIDPDIAVITNIGLDHIDWLGDTIEKVAFEKAGIIRNNIPVIFAGQQILPQAIQDKVHETRADLFQFEKDYFIKLENDKWYLATPSLTLSLPHGYLAHINQAAAVMAALHSGLQITQQQLEQGILNAKLAGRFEHRQYKNHQIILDVAHNPHGVEFLKQQLSRYLQLNPQIKQIDAVFSMLDDKDIKGVIELLTTTVNQWYIAPLNVARAATIDKLQAALNGRNITISNDIQSSFQLAVEQNSMHHLILVFGSFHTLEAVWESLIDGNE